MQICGASSELLLVFFGLSGVDDKHNIRNSDTSLSNVSGQDNLQDTKQTDFSGLPQNIIVGLPVNFFN